jgi:phytoene synthase
VSVDDAYRACERITAAEARNFYYGIRLLPRPKRRAMSALYALARRIDDIGDGDAPPASKLEALSEVRKDVAGLGAAPPGEDPVLVAVADACRRYPIPMCALEELIDGCEMDVVGTRFGSFEELVGYCRRVAGTVGRMSLAVYGCKNPALGEPLADDLGVALQLTNILRDVLEDRRMGRVYLPAEDLVRFGADPDLAVLAGGDPGGLRPAAGLEPVVAVVAFESGRAEEWFDRGLALLPMLDRRSRAATAAMAGIYRELLREIRRDPAAVLRGRLSLAPWRKASIAARALAKGAA